MITVGHTDLTVITQTNAQEKPQMFSLFSKLTSQKREIRNKNPLCMIHSTFRNIPVWAQFRRDNHLLLFNRVMNDDNHKLDIKCAMWNAPMNVNKVIYSNYYGSVIYTYAPWVPMTAKDIDPSFKIDGQKCTLLRSSPNKKIGLADVLMDTGRIKIFKLSEAIQYSYNFDMRFVLFLSIFLGFELWVYIAPELILNYPISLCSPNIKYLINSIQDTYVNLICINHREVSSPCECGEPINQMTREFFPHKPFDPLHIDNQPSGKIKTASIMVATIILTIVLTESVSRNGYNISI